MASDGGLYVPRQWPRFSHDEIAALRGLNYVETAVRVMLPFVGDSLSEDELRLLCTQAYGRFSHAAVTPLVQLDERNWLLSCSTAQRWRSRMWHFSFWACCSKFLSTRDTELTIVGATSGDTGSAAIDAVAGREKINIFMLHPENRVSEVQRRQMTTVLAPNVHNIAIKGSFDDAQKIVKSLFNDRGIFRPLQSFGGQFHQLGALMAQVVYYFYAAVRLGGPEGRLRFQFRPGILATCSQAMWRRNAASPSSD